jgi:hypothetical protein
LRREFDGDTVPPRCVGRTEVIPVDRVRLLQLRDELRTERTELTETLSAVEAALNGVEKLLARSGPSDSPPASHETAERQSRPILTDDENPRGSQAVETLLVESGSWMTVQDLTERQIERGWTPGGSGDPVNAVRAAANRLVRSKPDLFVRERGRYRYQGQSDRQSSLNGDGPETVQAQTSAPPTDRQLAVADGPASGDWQDLPRTEAVARMLAEVGEPLSPSELSRRLQGVGRNDPALAVGKALDHLHRKNQADTIGRARWVLTEQDDPRVVPPTTDVAQENDGSSDQGVNGVLLPFTGVSSDPEYEK